MGVLNREDSRSSEELLEAHRAERLSDDSTWDAMITLQDRGGITEFDIGRSLTMSENPSERSLGADLLAQLGLGTHPFQDEVVAILVGLLEDSEPEVINSAAVGLGHRDDPRAIDPLIRLASHTDERVRFGVAFGLLAHDDERAISTLIKLSSDCDSETRSWAMFGLGTQIETDTAEIRDALAAGLDDADSEVRGEALVGLAKRHDPRALQALPRELERDDIGTLALEAAAILADPNLVPHLQKLLDSLTTEDSERFASELEDAIEACRSGVRSV